MATLIGLCIRVKLMRVLPPRFKVRHICEQQYLECPERMDGFMESRTVETSPRLHKLVERSLQIEKQPSALCEPHHR